MVRDLITSIDSASRSRNSNDIVFFIEIDFVYALIQVDHIELFFGRVRRQVQQTDVRQRIDCRIARGEPQPRARYHTDQSFVGVGKWEKSATGHNESYLTFPAH